MRIWVPVAAIACVSTLTACSATDPPLIFGRMDSVGISASATAPDQGGTATIGYRSAKLAIVPVTTRDANGNVIVLKENRKVGTAIGDGALSTFANFEATGGAAKA